MSASSPLALFEQHPVLCLVLLVLLLLALSYYAIRPRNLPPGPWGIPWIGSPYLLSDDVHIDINNLAKKYGPLYTIMMGTRPAIMINDSDMIKEAFIKRADVFSNRPVMYALDYMDLFDELFNIHYSETWKEKKKIMVRILRNADFGSPSVEGWFQTNLDKMFVQFDRFQQKPVDLRDTLHHLLAITIAGIVYSADLDYGDAELYKVRGLAVDWVDSMFRSGMAKGYWADNVHHKITKYLLPNMMGNMKRAGNNFQRFLVEKIQEHKKTLDKDNPRDVIDGYLIERGDDPELTDHVFACNILMLFPDAIDSTGCYLEFITLYLAYYPDWQRKVQEQIDEVCGNRRPGLADRTNLPLVDATIYEAGRIGSVVCLTIAHSAQKDTTFHGYNIPEDSYILGNLWAAHMQKEHFPQGARFAPETLIDANGKFVKNPRIMMFGVGRRMCIGEPLVKHEIFLYVSNMLQRYSLKLPEGEPLPSLETRGGLIREPFPFKVCVIPRKTAEAKN